MKNILFIILILAGSSFAFIAHGQDAAYIRHSFEPWGQNDNINAMNAVFGTGNWKSAYFHEDPNFLFSNRYKFVFIDGSNFGTYEMVDFILNNLSLIEGWVNNGNTLFINSATNEAPNYAVGFGVSFVSIRNGDISVASVSASVTNRSHPIFSQKFSPLSYSYTGGYFAHDLVRGADLDIIITGDGNTAGAPDVILAEKSWGKGKVIFGTMTMPYFHRPQPEAQNLRKSIIQYIYNEAEQDAVPPVLSGVPAHVTVECDAVPEAPVVTATDDVSGSVPVTFSESRADGACAGTYTLTRTWRATDAAGNTATARQTINVEDNTPPVIAAVPAEGLDIPTDPQDAIACGVAVTFPAITATDACEGEVTLTYKVGEAIVNSGDVFGVGSTVVTIVAADDCGNEATESFTITVIDSEPPQVTAPEVVNRSNDEGQCGATFTLDDPAASDNCEIGSITNDAPSTFPVGMTEVTWTITDIHNNNTVVKQQVNVTDNEAPVVSVRPFTVQLDDAGQATVTAQQIDNGSTDNCDIESLVLDKTSFTCENLGPNTVVLTVKDKKGNVASKEAIVTVEDQVAPEITAPAAINVNNDAGSCNAMVELDQPTVLDNCAGVEVSNDAPVDGIFQLGVTWVTWTAEDASGNRATVQQKVEVTNEVPVITGITAPQEPVAINTGISASVSFIDNNVTTATFDWGDDGQSTETGGLGGSIAGSHTYTMPGVYTVSVTINDACGAEATTIHQYIVVYDPYGGFVTGGGWIESPVGASSQYPDAVGKANFGFVSKYKKGANVPTGDTEFQFKAGNLNFKSTSYEWLVVAGSNAKFKGVGTINGFGNYGFMLTATDGSPDLFRIKITDGNAVVYDNKIGEPDDSYAGTHLGGGSIAVHDAKGKNARYHDVAATAKGIEVEALDVPLNFKLNVYPNPVRESLSVEMESDTEEELTISIYDLLGRKIHEHKQNVVSGNNQIILDVDDWKVKTDQLLFRLHTPSKGLHQMMLLKPE